MTFKLDLRVRHRAKLLNDFDLLTNIDDSDVVAMEKKYHNHYLCDFYERMSKVTKNQIWKMTMTIVCFCGIVLSEVINHIRKTSETGSAGSHPIYLLAELRKLFRLYQRYVLKRSQCRFNNVLLKYMPSLKDLKKGKNIVLNTKDSTMGGVFKNLKRCREGDGMLFT